MWPKANLIPCNININRGISRWVLSHLGQTPPELMCLIFGCYPLRVDRNTYREQPGEKEDTEVSHEEWMKELGLEQKKGWSWDMRAILNKLRTALGESPSPSQGVVSFMLCHCLLRKVGFRQAGL